MEATKNYIQAFFTQRKIEISGNKASPFGDFINCEKSHN